MSHWHLLQLSRDGDGRPRLLTTNFDTLFERAAQDAGISPEGSGFSGVSFHYIVDSREAVDEIISKAVAAGGAVVKAAEGAQWGGYSGYFSDPDGHLWKAATSA